MKTMEDGAGDVARYFLLEGRFLMRMVKLTMRPSVRDGSLGVVKHSSILMMWNAGGCQRGSGTW